MRRHFAAAFLALMAVEAHAANFKTDFNACTELSTLSIPGRVIDAGPKTWLGQCAGPKGWWLNLVAEDPRSWVVVDDGEKAYPLYREIIEKFTPGDMPNVTGKAEWVADRAGNPTALILPVAYMRDGESAVTFMVFSLKKLPPRFLGYAVKLKGARKLAGP